MIGARTHVGSHASIEGPTVLGEENRVFAHAVLGFDPQDLKYHGEKTRLLIGSRNVFREFSTIHRGTVTGRGETVIGDNNYFMSYSHVAHDCRTGHSLLRHPLRSLDTWTGDRVVLGASWSSPVHPDRPVRVAGAPTQLRQDVLPFCKTDGTKRRHTD